MRGPLLGRLGLLLLHFEEVILPRLLGRGLALLPVIPCLVQVPGRREDGEEEEEEGGGGGGKRRRRSDEVIG